MLVLPKNDRVLARKMLDEEIAYKGTITMLVFGEGAAEEQIVNKAEVRTNGMPWRRVVWVRDASILTDIEFNIYRKGEDDIVACALNLDDVPVAHLDKILGNSYVNLEKAFLKAQHS